MGCFLSPHLKVKVSEDLIQSSIEDHTSCQSNVREHFPEEGLTLLLRSGKSSFLEVDSLAE